MIGYLIDYFNCSVIQSSITFIEVVVGIAISSIQISNTKIIEISIKNYV